MYRRSESFVFTAPGCDAPDIVSGIVEAGVERVRLTLGTGAQCGYSVSRWF